MFKAIRQGMGESTLREYVERSNKEFVNVRYLTDMMKFYFLEDDLRSRSLFYIDVEDN